MAVARLLCIDDDATLLNIRKLMFEGYGYKVTATTSPREGLRLFRQSTPDAVVIDYQMAEMDGARVAAEIKRQRPRVPVMMISSFPTAPEDARPYIDGFVTKGLSIKTVVDKLEQVIAAPPPPPPTPPAPKDGLSLLGSAVAGATALGLTYFRLKRAFRLA